MGIVVDFAQTTAFTVNGIELPYYGLCCLLGALAFTVLLESELARKQMDSDAWLILILAWVGARVGAKSMHCLNEEIAMSGWTEFGSCVFVNAQGGSFQGGLKKNLENISGTYVSPGSGCVDKKHFVGYVELVLGCMS